MRETIHDVLYWEITNLVQHIKDAFPGHNALPWVDAAVCKLIDARRELVHLLHKSKYENECIKLESHQENK